MNECVYVCISFRYTRNKTLEEKLIPIYESGNCDATRYVGKKVVHIYIIHNSFIRRVVAIYVQDFLS